MRERTLTPVNKERRPHRRFSYGECDLVQITRIYRYVVVFSLAGMRVAFDG
jgi:hypothetical protein